MSLYFTQKNSEQIEVRWWLVAIVTVSTIAALMFILPLYNVWSKELAGKAQLKEAEWNRQIAVQEAQARKESALLDAQAEVERAKGVKEANEIIAGSLKGNEEYLRYLWIDRVAGSNNVIYVPTEASLPILEAGLRR
ncbi:MAG: membrane protease subunit [Patescibacteria group bacterium]